MKKKLYLAAISSALIFFSGVTNLLHSEEYPLKLRFNDLENPHPINGKVVEIRGFLYEGKDGKKVLSNEPNLRTCCVGAKSKRKKQILINGDIGPSSSKYPVTVQGLFHIVDATKEDGDDARPLYQIEKASVIQNEYNTERKLSFIMLLAVISVGTLLFFFGLRRFQLLK